MKNLTIVILVLLSITIQAQQKPPSTSTPVSEQVPVKLTSTTDTVQYTLGAYIGQWMGKE